MRPLELTPGHRQANTDPARYTVIPIRDARVNRMVRRLYRVSALGPVRTDSYRAESRP
jgi:hypothetical protein